MIEQTVLAALTTGSPLPTSAGERVYAILLPQNSPMPAISYQRVATDPDASLSGNSGLDRVRLQIDCWSYGYAETKALAAEVRAVMGGIGALLLMDLDGYAPEEKLYRSTLDFSLWQK